MTVSYQVGGGGHLDIDFWAGIHPSEIGSHLLTGITSFLTLKVKLSGNTFDKTLVLYLSQRKQTVDMNIVSLML